MKGAGEAALRRAFRGRRVLVTGDTGFKGAWLCLRLADLGAEVHGYALPPEDLRGLFPAARLSRLIRHEDGDILDLPRLRRAFARARPEYLFHLAAQSLVRRSYRLPVETFAVNALGTAHVLECARARPELRAAVCATSDKCYENRETGRAYRETDPLGGRDPYSASKAASELVAAAYRSSFFEGTRLGAATVRAGNVIGGGDRAEDRLVPDLARALESGRPLVLRSPRSTRPWQHVLDPLTGYLLLAARLRENPARWSGAWNFGPAGRASRPAGELVAALRAAWGGRPAVRLRPSPLHEARRLDLDSSKSRRELGWRPAWGFRRAAAETAGWYRRAAAGEDPLAVSREQIAAHARERPAE